MHQKDDVRKRDQEEFFNQRRSQGRNRSLDERRSIVKRHNANTGGQPRLDLFDACLDRLNDGIRVGTAPGNDDPTDGLTGSFDERRHAERVADVDGCNLIDVDRHATRCRDHNLLEIIDALHESDASDDEPRATRFDDVAADVEIAVAHRGDDRTQGQAVRLQPVRIDIDLVLLHESTDRGDLCDARYGIQLVADEPILKAAKLDRKSVV